MYKKRQYLVCVGEPLSQVCPCSDTMMFSISACLIHYVMLKLQLIPSIVVVVGDAYKKYTFWQNIWEKIS